MTSVYQVAEFPTSELKRAIESQHGGTATLAQSVPVDERHEGKPVWQGVVHVFDLEGHPKAKRAYAWSYELPDGKRRFFAVLHMGGITGPVEAVRAAIVAESRCQTCCGDGKVAEAQDLIPAATAPDISFRTCPDCGGSGRKQPS